MLPEEKMIEDWLKIVDDFFDMQMQNQIGITAGDPSGKFSQSTRQGSIKNKMGTKPIDRIAVHCVAGLGRAPLLVALALIHRGCERINAIELIRK